MTRVFTTSLRRLVNGDSLGNWVWNRIKGQVVVTLISSVSLPTTVEGELFWRWTPDWQLFYIVMFSHIFRHHWERLQVHNQDSYKVTFLQKCGWGWRGSRGEKSRFKWVNVFNTSIKFVISLRINPWGMQLDKFRSGSEVQNLCFLTWSVNNQGFLVVSVDFVLWTTLITNLQVLGWDPT
jgi:hypothetical protein